MTWRRALDLATASVLVTMLTRLLADPTYVNHDCSALLMGPLMVSEGRMPLSALFAAMNPPLISYFNLFVVTVASGLGMNLILVFNLTVLSLVILSVVAFRRLLAGSGLVSIPVAAFLALAWAGVLLTLFDSDFSFGQREHLLVLAFVPYLAGRWRQWEGAPLALGSRVLLGAVAGLATCLKPHYLLVPAAVELSFILVRRRLSPALSADVIAYALTGVAFVAHLFLLPSELRTPFLEGAASTLRGYEAYDSPWTVLARSSPIRFTLIVCPAVLALLVRIRTPATRLAGIFATTGLISTAVYFAQHKGWGYHTIPALSAALLATSVLAARLGPRLEALFSDRAAWAFRLTAVAAALMVASAALEAVTLLRSGVRPVLRSPFAQTLLRLSRPQEEILFLTTDVYPMFPTLLELDRRTFGVYWGPTMNLAFYQAGRTPTRDGFPYPLADQMDLPERRFLERLARDIRNGRPRLIVVADGPHLQGCPPGFDLMEYLHHVPAVVEALSPYSMVARVPVIRDGGISEGYRFLSRGDDLDPGASR